MIINTLFGKEEVLSKMCRECKQILPFTSFNYRNKTKGKPELTAGAPSKDKIKYYVDGLISKSKKDTK